MKWAPSSPGEVDRVERSLHGLRARLVVRRDEAAAAEARVEVEARRDRVDVMTAKGRPHLVEIVGRQLLRVVELVAVDQVPETLDGSANAVDGRLVRELGLVAGGNESRSHRTERPDSERGLHVAPS